MRRAIITTSRPTAMLCNADVMKLEAVNVYYICTHRGAFNGSGPSMDIPTCTWTRQLIYLSILTIGLLVMATGKRTLLNQETANQVPSSGWGDDIDFDPFQQASTLGMRAGRAKAACCSKARTFLLSVVSRLHFNESNACAGAP